MKMQNLLLPRLLDQLSVLSQLELEAKTVRATDKERSGWNGLPQGKLSLRNDSVEVLNAILGVHTAFLQRFRKNGTIESNGKLFWVTVGFHYFNLVY